MKANRPLYRRLMELGILHGRDIKITRHHNGGYILQVRNCTYVIGKDGTKTVMEIVGEIQQTSDQKDLAIH